MKAKEGKVVSIGGKYNAVAERSENVIGSRIADGRKKLGWNLGILSEALKEYGVDLTKASINKWETGDSIPNAYQFLAVCNALGLDHNLTTFMKSYTPELNEEGQRRLAQYKYDLICSGNYRPEPKPIPQITYVDMPVALMPAAAGTGNLLDDMEYYETVSFPEDQINPGANVGIRVSGDSMEPVYHDGQVVWVQRCAELHPGEVGIFVYEDKAFIKVYGEQDPDEDVRDEFTDSYGTIRRQPVLISYNSEKYDPIVVSPYIPFRIFGRVLR